MTINEKIAKAREDYQKEITKLILEGIANEEIKVTGTPVGLNVLTVSLKIQDMKIMEVWVGNTDDELSSLYEYEFKPLFKEKENRKIIMKYIEDKINK
jgi:hypothetical protein